MTSFITREKLAGKKESLWVSIPSRRDILLPRGTGHLFVTGKDPVMTGKYAQMTGFSRLLTGKILVQSLWVVYCLGAGWGGEVEQ